MNDFYAFKKDYIKKLSYISWEYRIQQVIIHFSIKRGMLIITMGPAFTYEAVTKESILVIRCHMQGIYTLHGRCADLEGYFK